MNRLNVEPRPSRSPRALAALPVGVLTLCAATAASFGIQASHRATDHASGAPSPGRTQMAPACAPPTVLDIDGLGADATWTVSPKGSATIGRSITIRPLSSAVSSAQVVVGDPSMVADRSDLAVGSRDVVARAAASSTADPDPDLVSLVADLVVNGPGLGNLPVFALIDYTPTGDCPGAEGGHGVVAVPVGTLVVR